MVFAGRAVNEISDDELVSLVENHVAERRSLEFKVTVKTSNDDERAELLRDVASLANAEGGYIVVGIRDDGKGRAQKFEPGLVGDVDRIARSAMGLCLEHISERIEGLEIAARRAAGNPLVLIRVPNSARRPHMISLGGRTEFVTRHHDGKRAMSIGELREAFHGDEVIRRVAQLESTIRLLAGRADDDRERVAMLKAIDAEQPVKLSRLQRGDMALEAAHVRFKKRRGAAPAFWICATPIAPKMNAVDVDSEALHKVLRNPPGSRHSGWNMEIDDRPRRVADGVVVGDADFRELTLLPSGHLEFVTPLDEHFAWQQRPEEFASQPRLYPFAMVEFPTTFLRLYRELVAQFHVTGPFLVQLALHNARGWRLPPYRPGVIGYEARLKPLQPLAEDGVTAGPNQIADGFDADLEARNLLQEVYAAFGLTTAHIPFFDATTNKFEFR